MKKTTTPKKIIGAQYQVEQWEDKRMESILPPKGI
jgi:hypothetical protein